MQWCVYVLCDFYDEDNYNDKNSIEWNAIRVCACVYECVCVDATQNLDLCETILLL